MRPDMMVVEMTESEQRRYLPHDANTGQTLPHLPANMPNGRQRRITIVEGGYCRDTSYLEKLEEKGQQHAKLEDALRTYGYKVKSVTYICGCTGSLFRSNGASMRDLGIESTVASRLKDKLHAHSITCNCADNLMKTRRWLERSSLRRNRADPP